MVNLSISRCGLVWERAGRVLHTRLWAGLSGILVKSWFNLVSMQDLQTLSVEIKWTNEWIRDVFILCLEDFAKVNLKVLLFCSISIIKTFCVWFSHVPSLLQHRNTYQGSPMTHLFIFSLRLDQNREGQAKGMNLVLLIGYKNVTNYNKWVAGNPYYVFSILLPWWYLLQ